MAEKTKPIVVENPPPKKKVKPKGTSTGLPRDIQFLGEALVKETNRINELKLSMESLRNVVGGLENDLKRVMNRMGL